MFVYNLLYVLCLISFLFITYFIICFYYKVKNKIIIFYKNYIKIYFLKKDKFIFNLF